MAKQTKGNTMDEELIEQIAKIIDPVGFTNCETDSKPILAVLKSRQETARERARQVTTLLWEHFHRDVRKAIMEHEI